MMASLIDRKQLKSDMKALLADAQVSPKAMTALYLGLTLVLNLVDSFAGGSGLLSTFLSILTSLLGLVLGSGFALYCMAVRRGERAEFLTLFDGFSFVGKLIGLNIIMYLFIALWSMLFVIPGLIAAYRYRFALLDLCENPDLGVMEALALSRRQSFGFKSHLFLLDMSYLGWKLLSILPSILYSLSAAYSLLQQTWTQFSGTSLLAAAPVDVSLSPLVLVLFFGVWALVVSLFYYPNFVCTELGYFELAKRSAARAAGPDDLGSL